MRLEFQVKVSRPSGVLIEGQREENGSQEENRVVMQCNYKSEYGRNGYRKRIDLIRNEMEMFNVTEQRLVDQKNNILKRKWLSDLELADI